ncbi:MAG: hypothetical protein ACLGIY_13635 [Betaproteobacteria bacterium]
MSGTTTPGGQTAAQPAAAPAAAFTQADLDAARLAGATQERERIQAVLAVGANLPGHEKLLGTLAFDGKTTAPEASMAVLKAEGDQRAAAIKAHADDAPPAAQGSAAPADKGAKTKQQMAAEAEAHAKKTGVDVVTALKELGYAS